MIENKDNQLERQVKSLVNQEIILPYSPKSNDKMPKLKKIALISGITLVTLVSGYSTYKIIKNYLDQKYNPAILKGF